MGLTGYLFMVNQLPPMEPSLLQDQDDIKEVCVPFESNKNADELAPELDVMKENLHETSSKPVQEISENSTWLDKIKFISSFSTLTMLMHNTETRPHWNEVKDGVILSALPIETCIGKHGNHGLKLLQESEASGRPLGLVISCVKPFELKGDGLPFTPVQPSFWLANHVEHIMLEMQDFTGTVDLDTLDSAVDAIERMSKDNKSVVIHCKAGRGRSFSVVMCWLIKYTDLNVTDALALIASKRSQVSPSASQFDLVENYRARFCPTKDPLNMNSVHVDPYQQDLLKLTKNPLMHTVALGLLLTPVGFVAASAAALLGGGVSWYLQKMRVNMTDSKFSQLKAECEANIQQVIDTMTIDESRALQSGLHSGNDWGTWAETVFDRNALVHYDTFLAGDRISREKFAWRTTLQEGLAQKLRLFDAKELEMKQLADAVGKENDSVVNENKGAEDKQRMDTDTCCTPTIAAVGEQLTGGSGGDIGAGKEEQGGSEAEDTWAGKEDIDND